MKLLDEKLLAEIADDSKTSGGLGQQVKDFLNSLEEMAEEVEDEPDSID